MRTQESYQAELAKLEEQAAKLKLRAAGHAPGRIQSSYVVNLGKQGFLILSPESLPVAISRGWITAEQAKNAPIVRHNFNATEKDEGKRFIVRGQTA